jgi:hypothetical protein
MQALHDFKLNFENTERPYMARKQTFTQIFEPFIHMVQMIYHWIDSETSQLFHVLSSV